MDLHDIFFLLVALALLITFHEAGHFLVARWAGVHVVRFCIGFGKPILSWRDKRGTEFCIAVLPLGGYVRMLDWRDADAASHAPADPVLAERSFDRLKPQWRIAIALGGPGANFLLAFLFYWLIAVVGFSTTVPLVGIVAEDSPAYRAGLRGSEEIVAVDGRTTASWTDIGLALAARLGETGSIEIGTLKDGRAQAYAIAIEDWHSGASDPDPIDSLGIGFEPPAVIGRVLEDEPAMRGGLMARDRITHVDGEPIASWGGFVERVRASPGESLRLTVERQMDTERRTRVEQLRVTPAVREDDEGNEYGYIGAGLPTRLVQYGFFAAAGHALRETWSKSALTVEMIGKMLTLQVSPENIAGPITIAKVTSNSARAGFDKFLSVLALISISLGVLNLLPIPILDGGLVVLNTVELVRRKPVSARMEAMGARIGIALVAGLMLLAFYNDITRWFWTGS